MIQPAKIHQWSNLLVQILLVLGTTISVVNCFQVAFKPVEDPLLTTASIHRLDEYGLSCVSNYKWGTPDCNTPESFVGPDELSTFQIAEVDVSPGLIQQSDMKKIATLVDTDTDKDGKSVRRVVIKFSCGPHDHQKIGDLIDEFLTTRPWWRVHEEPHSWHHRPSLSASAEQVFSIILDRYAPAWEKKLRHIASVQFPGEENCEKMSMYIDHDFGPCLIYGGWGWYTELWGHRTADEMQYAIFSPFCNPNMDPLYSTPYISGQDCPDKINKWDCIFLRNTECQMPREITECSSQCKNLHFFHAYKDTYPYAQATPEGKFIETKSLSQEELLTYFPRQAITEKQAQLAAAGGSTQPIFKYVVPYDRAGRNLPDQQSNINYAAAFAFAFLYRMNYSYRRRVAQMAHIFRHQVEPPFLHDVPCVAAHIRRQDRMIANVDMVEYCHNATRELAPGEKQRLCLNSEHKFYPCQMGKCSGKVPFGLVTLEMIVARAKTLVGPSVRTLYVMSDDPEWVDEHKKLLATTNPEWRIIDFDFPTFDLEEEDGGEGVVAGGEGESVNDRKRLRKRRARGRRQLMTEEVPYDELRYGGTRSGVYWFASVALAQQCGALIGHTGSTAFRFIFGSMCMENALGREVCPPMWTLEQGP